MMVCRQREAVVRRAKRTGSKGAGHRGRRRIREVMVVVMRIRESSTGHRRRLPAQQHRAVHLAGRGVTIRSDITTARV